MKFYIIVFLLFCAGNLAAQNNIESILRSIEKNNKELQASEQLTLSKKLEAATENTLPDPNVSYERKWGKPASIGKPESCQYRRVLTFHRYMFIKTSSMI